MMSQVESENGKAVSILTLHLQNEPSAHYIFESELIPITAEDEKAALPILIRELGIQESLEDIEDQDIDRVVNAAGVFGVPFVDFSALL